MKVGIEMNDPIVLTAAEIAYLSSAWPEAIASRVRHALGIRGGQAEEVLLAGLGSLLERGLVAEADSESGYAPGVEAKVAMLGMYGAQATVEFATVLDRHLQSLTIFAGPTLRLGVLAAPAARYAIGLYAADVDWVEVLVDGIRNALLAAPDAICLVQFRSASGVLERMAVRGSGDRDWSIADSTADDAVFQPVSPDDLRQRVASALAGVGLNAPVAG